MTQAIYERDNSIRSVLLEEYEIFYYQGLVSEAEYKWFLDSTLYNKYKLYKLFAKELLRTRKVKYMSIENICKLLWEREPLEAIYECDSSVEDDYRADTIESIDEF